MCDKDIEGEVCINIRRATFFQSLPTFFFAAIFKRHMTIRYDRKYHIYKQRFILMKKGITKMKIWYTLENAFLSCKQSKFTENKEGPIQNQIFLLACWKKHALNICKWCIQAYHHGFLYIKGER
jgi:hypothetical protein